MKKFEYKTKPFNHQRTALKQGAKWGAYAYFMEMGTGKTKVAIDNANYLFSTDSITHVMVVAPNSVYRNWIKEIDFHSYTDYTISVHKDKKTYGKGKIQWFLINVEALSHKSGVDVISKLINRHGKKMLWILDESTTIKNKSAKRTRNICKLGKQVAYKRILTGSPITKSPLDLYTQCEFLSPDLLGFTSYFTFRARYAVMQQIEMGGKQMPTINQDEVSFANKLTEILRLHQVTNGFVNSDDGTIQVFDDCPKIKELLNILEESDGKFIIWANYVQNIKTIINKLKEKYGAKSVVSIFGEISTEDRQEAVRRFQDDDSCRFFIGNPSTGGYGLTLTAASYVVYFSNSYNLEVREQSEDRAHRIGQDKNVTYIDLIAENTIDEFIVGALDKKMKLSAQTLGEEVKKWIK
jgi:SNF2 family DNA or RNA helicase